MAEGIGGAFLEFMPTLAKSALSKLTSEASKAGADSGKALGDSLTKSAEAATVNKMSVVGGKAGKALGDSLNKSAQSSANMAAFSQQINRELATIKDKSINVEMDSAKVKMTVSSVNSLLSTVDDKIHVETEIDTRGAGAKLRDLADDMNNTEQEGRILSGVLAAIGPAVAGIAPVAIGAVAGVGAAAGAAGLAFGLWGAAVKSVYEGFKTQQEKVDTLKGKLASLDAEIAKNKQLGIDTNKLEAEKAKLLEKVNAEYAKLPEGSREAFDAFEGMKGAWEDFIKNNGAQVYGPMKRVFDTIVVALAKLQPMMDVGAKAGDALTKKFESFVKGGGLDTFVQFISKNAGPALENLGGIAKNLGTFLGNIFKNFAPSGQGFLKWLNEATSKLAKWSAGDGLTKFVEYMTSNGGKVASILADIAKAAVNIAQAVAPLAPVSLAVAQALAKIIEAIPQPVITALVASIVAYRTAVAATTAVAKTAAVASGLWAGAQGKNTQANTTNTASIVANRVALVAHAVATKASTVAAAALNVVMKANPFAIIVTAVAALAAGIVLLYKNNETARKIIDGAWKAIKTAFSSVTDWFTNTAWPAMKKAFEALGTATEAVKNAVKSAWEKIKSDIDTAWKAINIVFKAIDTFLTTTLTTAFKNFLSAVETVWTTVKTSIETAWSNIKKTFDAIVSFLADTFKAAWEAFQKGVKIVWDEVSRIIDVSWKAIKIVFETVIKFLETTFKNGWEAFQKIVDTVWSAIKTLIDEAWKVIKATFDVIIKFLSGDFKGAWEAFQKLIDTVWEAIKKSISTVWDAIKIIFETIIKFLQTTFKDAWDTFLKLVDTTWTAIKDSIDTIWKAIKVIWETVIKFLETTFKNAWDTFSKLVKTTWDAIKENIDTAWTGIKKIWQAIIDFMEGTFKKAWDTLKKMVGDNWDSIKDKLKSGWDNIKKDVFDPVVKFVKETIPDAFDKAVQFVKKAWDKIVGVVREPIKTVVNTVIRDGIVAAINKVASFVGSSGITGFKGMANGGVVGGGASHNFPIPGLATGGVLPGYTPGRDVHMFTSPTGGALALSGGEAVMRPEFTRALGSEAIERINRAARMGGVSAVSSMLDGGPARFANGGIVAGPIGDGIGDTISKLWDTVTNPVESIKKLVNASINKIPGSGPMKTMLIKGGEKVLKYGLDWIKKKFDATLGSGQLPGTGAVWERLVKVIKAKFPSIGITSTVRPGATTLSGNSSYHSMGRAIDTTPMREAANWIYKTYGKNTKELITPWLDRMLHNGKPHKYSKAVEDQHGVGSAGNDHIHWAMKLGGIFKNLAMKNGGLLNAAKIFDQGGILRPGGIGINTGRKPEAVLTPEESAGLKSMSVDKLAELLEQLIDEVRSNGHTVGGYIRGSGKSAIAQGRSI